MSYVPEGGVSAGIIFLLQNRGKIATAFFSVLLNFFGYKTPNETADL
jgi:hypothetical protein